MIICVSSSGNDLQADVDQRFGRCSYFLLIDSDTMSFEVLTNEGLIASGGAGIQAAQQVTKTNAKIVVTGNIGPNAFQTLEAAHMKVITGVKGPIKEIVEKILQGELKETNIPNVKSHFGMGK